MTDKPIDWTKPVQTRDGRKAYPMKQYVPTLVTLTDGREELMAFDENGKVVGRSIEHDLENVPEKRVIYVNAYPNGNVSAYTSKQDANALAASVRCACIRVEYEEGQFDE